MKQYSTRVVLSGLLISLTLLLLAAPMRAADQAPRCFSETGQCITGELRTYWEQNGGLPVFGFPIAPARPEIDQASGHTFVSQWFERNRLEVHPENNPPYRVLLGRLGDQRIRQTGRSPLTLPKGNLAQPHFYTQTGHAIAPQFWDYWHGHGLELGDQGISERESLALFGYPISEAQMEPVAGGGQVLTQWFERARFEYHPDKPDPNKVLLGLLGDEMKPALAGPGLSRLNFYRQQVGSPPVEQNPSLVVSAQAHANYLVLNGEASNPHVERQGLPGFTGAEIIDRVKAAGYGYSAGYSVSDLVVPLEDPSASIDSLVDLPLHRVVLFSPEWREAGYSNAVRLAGGKRVAYSVLDLGTGPLNATASRAPYLIAYPIDRQTDVPASWNYVEFPNPLPSGATLPAGYPFSLQGAYGTLLVDSAEMRDAKGGAVAVHPNPASCSDPSHNCYIMIPVAPLQVRATYTVHVRGALGSASFDRTWQFTTGTANAPR